MGGQSLGLSTQVPSKIIYLTDGPNKEVPIGAQDDLFQARTAEGFGWA